MRVKDCILGVRTNNSNNDHRYYECSHVKSDLIGKKSKFKDWKDEQLLKKE